jgi:hypothetical protein
MRRSVKPATPTWSAHRPNADGRQTKEKRATGWIARFLFSFDETDKGA